MIKCIMLRLKLAYLPDSKGRILRGVELDIQINIKGNYATIPFRFG